MPCAHAFEPVKSESARLARCRACGLDVTVSEADFYAAGLERGRSEAADVEALARPSRSRALALPWAVATLAVALSGALAVSFARGPAPGVVAPLGPPVGVSGLGSCLVAASQLEADVEEVYGRVASPAAVAVQRARVRDALAEADAALSDLSEAVFDWRACAESKIPGCAEHMPARINARTREADEAARLLEGRIAAARFTREPPERPARGKAAP